MTGDVPDGDRSAPEPGAEGPAPRERAAAWLTTVRADDTRRRWALAGALAVGLVLAWLHWSGLVVAGAVVGLTRRRLRRAVVAGLAVGVLAVVGTPIVAPAVGVSGFLRLDPINYVTVAVALLLPAWGALTRYVV